jgi:hypothetical protein
MDGLGATSGPLAGVDDGLRRVSARGLGLGRARAPGRRLAKGCHVASRASLRRRRMGLQRVGAVRRRLDGARDPVPERRRPHCAARRLRVPSPLPTKGRWVLDVPPRCQDGILGPVAPRDHARRRAGAAHRPRRDAALRHRARRPMDPKGTPGRRHVGRVLVDDRPRHDGSESRVPHRARVSRTFAAHVDVRESRQRLADGTSRVDPGRRRLVSSTRDAHPPTDRGATARRLVGRQGRATRHQARLRRSMAPCRWRPDVRRPEASVHHGDGGGGVVEGASSAGSLGCFCRLQRWCPNQSGRRRTPTCGWRPRAGSGSPVRR